MNQATATPIADLKPAGAAVATVTDTPNRQLARFLDNLKGQMHLALPKHLNVDRMARLVLSAFSTNPTLHKCTPQSIAAAVMTASQLGLEIGVNGHAYLVPYFDHKKKIYVCTFIPGWKGLVDLVSRAGRATVWTGASRAGDEFDYQLGDSPYCKHKPGDAEDDEAPFDYVYAIGRVRDAVMPVIEVWSRAKVLKHLARYNKQGDRHYALTSENNLEMYGRKVALLQVLKYVPASIELQNAIAVDNAVEAGKGVILEGSFVNVQQEDEADPATGEVPPPAAQAPAQGEQNTQQKAPPPAGKAIAGAVGAAAATASNPAGQGVDPDWIAEHDRAEREAAAAAEAAATGGDQSPPQDDPRPTTRRTVRPAAGRRPIE